MIIWRKKEICNRLSGNREPGLCSPGPQILPESFSNFSLPSDFHIVLWIEKADGSLKQNKTKQNAFQSLGKIIFT